MDLTQANQAEPTLSKSAEKRLKAQEHNKNYVASPELVTLTIEQREELEVLSKEVFNSTSRYATLLAKGEVRPVMVTVTEYVPSEKEGEEGTTREVEVVDALPGHPKSTKLQTVRYTVESIKTHMLEIKVKQDRMRELLAKMQADKKSALEKIQKDKEEVLAKQRVLESLMGSAV